MVHQIIALLFAVSIPFTIIPVNTTLDNATAPVEPISSTTSSNWAGYVADNTNTYSGVGATWDVRARSVSDTNEISTDATWVGIGGVKNHDLIQIGTQAVIQNGAIEYQAWYETLPDYQTIIPLTISAGDSVTATLSRQSSDSWHIMIKDNTSRES